MLIEADFAPLKDKAIADYYGKWPIRYTKSRKESAQAVADRRRRSEESPGTRKTRLAG